MFKVTVRNEKLIEKKIESTNNGFMQAIFETEEKANIWITHVKSIKEYSDSETICLLEDITFQVEQEKEKVVAKKYLADTDWYVVRKMDVGVEIPIDVVEKRNNCRKVL